MALAQQVAEVEASEGEVKLNPAKDLTLTILPTQGEDLFLNDVVTTLSKAKARLRFIDASIISLGENTRLRLSKLIFDPTLPRDAEYELSSGLALFQVSKVVLSKLFQVITPIGTFRAKGTVFTLEVSPAKTTLVVMEGVVEFTDALGAVTLISAGQRMEVTSAGASVPAAVEPAEQGRLLGAVTSFVAPSISVTSQLTVIDQVLGVSLSSLTNITLKVPVLKTALPSLLGPKGVLQESLLQPSLLPSLALPGVLSLEQSAAGLSQINGVIIR